MVEGKFPSSKKRILQRVINSRFSGPIAIAILASTIVGYAAYGVNVTLRPSKVSTPSSSAQNVKCPVEEVRKYLESKDSNKGKVEISVLPKKEAGIEAMIKAYTLTYNQEKCGRPTAVLYENDVPKAVMDINWESPERTGFSTLRNFRGYKEGLYTFWVEIGHPHGIKRKSEPVHLYVTGKVLDRPPEVKIHTNGPLLEVSVRDEFDNRGIKSIFLTENGKPIEPIEKSDYSGKNFVIKNLQFAPTGFGKLRYVATVTDIGGNVVNAEKTVVAYPKNLQFHEIGK